MSAASRSIDFESVQRRLDGEVEEVEIDAQSENLMHFYDGTGMGATLIDDRSEGIEMDLWEGGECSVYIDDDCLRISGNPADHVEEGLLNDILLGNFETETTSEVATAFQETYNQIMENGERGVEPAETRNLIEDVSEYALDRMNDENLKFTNLRYRGNKGNMGDIIISYGDKNAVYGSNEKGPGTITIKTEEAHDGYSSTVFAYELGQRLLQDSDRKPEVCTGWAYKGKEHHRKKEQQANPALREQFN